MAASGETAPSAGAQAKGEAIKWGTRIGVGVGVLLLVRACSGFAIDTVDGAASDAAGHVASHLDVTGNGADISDCSTDNDSGIPVTMTQITRILTAAAAADLPMEQADTSAAGFISSMDPVDRPGELGCAVPGTVGSGKLPTLHLTIDGMWLTDALDSRGLLGSDSPLR